MRGTSSVVSSSPSSLGRSWNGGGGGESEEVREVLSNSTRTLRLMTLPGAPLPHPLLLCDDLRPSSFHRKPESSPAALESLDRLLFGAGARYLPPVPSADVRSRPACRASVRAAGPEPRQGDRPQAQPGSEPPRAAAEAASQPCSPASCWLLLKSGWIRASNWSLWNLCPLPFLLSLMLSVLCVSGLVPSVVH